LHQRSYMYLNHFRMAFHFHSWAVIYVPNRRLGFRNEIVICGVDVACAPRLCAPAALQPPPWCVTTACTQRHNNSPKKLALWSLYFNTAYTGSRLGASEAAAGMHNTAIKRSAHLTWYGFASVKNTYIHIYKSIYMYIYTHIYMHSYI